MSKIDAAVRQNLEGTGNKAIVIAKIVDAGNADTSSAAGATRAEKAQNVHDAKVALAQTSQQEIQHLRKGSLFHLSA